MAGSYPDVPGPRMAWDRDGTAWIAVNLTNGTVTQTSPAPTAPNDESVGGTSVFSGEVNVSYAAAIALIFPEQRDVVGVLPAWSFEQGSPGALEWSTDTTNGLDGTWTSLGTWTNQPNNVEAMRKSITSVSISGAKAVRFRYTTGSGGGGRSINVRSLHLYGKPSAGEAPNRLRIWHPTLDQEVTGAYFDWGDTPRNATVTKTFRVKNPSAQTAHDVTLTTEALTDTTPTNVSQHAYSLDDGATFSSSLNIGDIAPGAASPVITVRRQVPADAALSLWWARIVASAQSWS